MTRPRIGAGALLAAAVLVTGGCSTGSVPDEPFGEFIVTESGGIDGRYHPLLVRPDGVALLMSNEPAAGSIPGSDLERLRVLLTSEAFRREAAAEAREGDRPTCADGIVWTVTMGDLIVDHDECADTEPTPATDEIIGLLADEVRGEFADGVPAGPPDLIPVTVERQATSYAPAATFVSTAAGMVTFRPIAGAEQTQPLDPSAHDTLRLLLDRLADSPPSACERPGPYRLEIGASQPVSVTDCVGTGPPEVRATVALLENLFER